jgi:hypothetical protein
MWLYPLARVVYQAFGRIEAFYEGVGSFSSDHCSRGAVQALS